MKVCFSLPSIAKVAPIMREERDFFWIMRVNSTIRSTWKPLGLVFIRSCWRCFRNWAFGWKVHRIMKNLVYLPWSPESVIICFIWMLNLIQSLHTFMREIRRSFKRTTRKNKNLSLSTSLFFRNLSKIQQKLYPL